MVLLYPQRKHLGIIDKFVIFLSVLYLVKKQNGAEQERGQGIPAYIPTGGVDVTYQKMSEVDWKSLKEKECFLVNGIAYLFLGTMKCGNASLASYCRADAREFDGSDDCKKFWSLLAGA